MKELLYWMGLTIQVRLTIERHDLWVGLYWKHRRVVALNIVNVWDFYACPLPAILIHANVRHIRYGPKP